MRLSAAIVYGRAISGADANVPEEVAVALIVGRGKLGPQSLEFNLRNACELGETLELVLDGVLVGGNKPRRQETGPGRAVLRSIGEPTYQASNQSIHQLNNPPINRLINCHQPINQ